MPTQFSTAFAASMKAIPVKYQYINGVIKLTHLLGVYTLIHDDTPNQ